MLQPGVRFQQCPIKASMGVFGRKWTTLILRDIGFRHSAPCSPIVPIPVTSYYHGFQMRGTNRTGDRLSHDVGRPYPIHPAAMSRSTISEICSLESLGYQATG